MSCAYMTLEHQNIREQTIGEAFTEANVCRKWDSGPNGVVLVQVLRGAIFTYGVMVGRREGVCW